MIFDLRSALITSVSIVPRGSAVNLLNLESVRMGGFTKLSESLPIVLRDYAQINQPGYPVWTIVRGRHRRLPVSMATPQERLKPLRQLL
jgi:hypothetical protein